MPHGVHSGPSDTARPELGEAAAGIEQPVLTLAGDLGPPEDRWGWCWPVEPRGTVIGRTAGIGAEDALVDPSLSGRHAEVTGRDGRFFVRPLKPGARVLVNGCPVGGDGPVEVREGDAIQCSWTVFVLRCLPPGVETVHHSDGRVLQGLSPALSGLRRDLHDLSRIDPAAERTLLLTGETGAGKEIAALEYLRRLRERSGRRDLVLEHENLAHGEHLRFRLCGAWPGSFADTDRKDGVLRRAGRGIAFLDEVGELPLEAQAELLTFLQPRRDGRMYVTPEGEPPAGSRSGGLPVECTVVFGTNRDLDARVAEGLFRLDLLQRISHYRRRIPPLRERREDIPLLLRQALRERGVPDDHWISPDLLAGLLSHPLPGNARSLNRLAAHLRLAGEDRITDPFRTRSDLTGRYHTFRDLPGEVLEEILGRSAAPDRGLAGSEAQPRPEPRTEAEMVRLLQDAGNSAAGALRLMGRVASNRTAFYRLLDRFGVPHNETDRTRWLRDRTAASPEDVPGT